MQYKPSQIDAIESLRESPYCSMFGCAETQCIAKNIVKWLIANGDHWDIELPALSQFGTLWEQKHEHTTGGEPRCCDFLNDYMAGRYLKDEFTDCCHRHCDGLRLRKEILVKLFPDITW